MKNIKAGLKLTFALLLFAVLWWSAVIVVLSV